MNSTDLNVSDVAMIVNRVRGMIDTGQSIGNKRVKFARLLVKPSSERYVWDHVRSFHHRTSDVVFATRVKKRKSGPSPECYPVFRLTDAGKCEKVSFGDYQLCRLPDIFIDEIQSICSMTIEAVEKER